MNNNDIIVKVDTPNTEGNLEENFLTDITVNNKNDKGKEKFKPEPINVDNLKVKTSKSTLNVSFKENQIKSPTSPSHRLRNQIRKRTKTISRLLKESNEIKESYKPGIFEEVINGPRGPDVRLHRHKVIVGLLKLLIILCLTAGIVLLSVISLCITINVGYVCVQIDTVNTFVQMIFFAFYFDALYYITRSLWRTYLRAIQTIMSSKFGSSMNDLFVKRLLGYLFSVKIAEWTLPEKYENHPKDWYEKVNLIVFVIFLLLCLLPLLLIAVFFGYWKITGTVCLLFVCGGAATVIGLNLYSRFILFIKFFRRLDEFYYNAPFYIDKQQRVNNQTSYLRLTYCTTYGLDGGENPFNYVLNLLIHVVISIGIASLIFGSFDPDVKKALIIVGALIILLPLRFRKYIRKFLVKLHILSKEKLDKKNEENMQKVNAEMDLTHKNYMDTKRTSQDITQLTSGSSSKKRSIFSIFKSKNKNNNGSDCYREIPINSPDNDDHTRSVNEHNMNEINQDMRNMNNNTTLDNDSFVLMNNNKEGGDGNSTKVYQNTTWLTPESSLRQRKSNDRIRDSRTSQLLVINNLISGLNTEEPEHDSFYYLLKSNKSYIRRKTLLTWDINTLISWKGCLTVFFSRCVKYIVGITFMALLNYNRYSEGADDVSTHNNLLMDVITHVIFILIVLGQDILYLMPMSDSTLSMRNRKIAFIILLILEFILVINIPILIENKYIPMAFIVLAYANFVVYPDPRYTWDDEKIQRKTFFDLFRPELNLRSDISYGHYIRTKGFTKFKKNKGIIKKLRNKKKSNNEKAKRKNDPTTSDEEYITDNDSLDSQNMKGKEPEIQITNEDGDVTTLTDINSNSNSNSYTNIYSNSNISSNSNNSSNNNSNNSSCNNSVSDFSITSKTFSNNVILNGLNEEALMYEPVPQSAVRKEPKNVYLDINGQNYKIKKKFDGKAEFSRVIKNITSEMQYKRNTRARYNSSAIIVVVAGVVFISVVLGIIFAKTSDIDYTFERDATMFTPRPAICQWRGDNISINEFAVLSCACYYKTTDDINYSWLYGRPETSKNNFTIGENNINPKEGEQKKGVQYVDFINKETNTIVVAIRGTSTMEDIFQDIYIWSASALLQLSGNFGTFIRYWPRETIASLVNVIVNQFTNLQFLYWKEVEDHIKELRIKTNSTIYLTGHSLGGGVAGVVSAHLNIPAITFSSPGLGYSYKTYGIELKQLINNFVNVVPMSDPVPLLDSQVGQIQNIECNTQQPLSCHSIYNTIDTLNSMCRENSSYRYWDDADDKVYKDKKLNYKMPY